MPEQSSFDYALIRVVPRVEKEEFINAGVVVFCLEKNFLEARVRLEDERLRALWPEIDIELVRQHLEAVVKIASGNEDGGPIAKLSIRERFHWLVAPRSTMIQPSAVHTGLCVNPAASLDHLFKTL